MAGWKDGGVFCEIFGETPRNKIIEFLLETRELDYSIGDIAKEVKLNRATTYNVMEGLIEEKIVVPTRKVSNGQLYKLNPEKEEVKALIQVFNMLLKKSIEKSGIKEAIAIKCKN
ncbi:hypothetical protein J4405_00175 [Candidatus Woesearchaeota archaeon]|nr:hypothetical protein [Candidatus Woesearchaeota archaeon]